MRLEDAIADLDELGLSYRPIPQENSTVAEDVVHATDPVAGTIVVDGQTVTLFYNPRQELVEVPNVEGRTLDEAVRTLSAAGFTVGEQTPEESEDIPEGSVIRTDPAAGELVPQSEVINLVVSSGPDQVAMPSTVIGETEADARAVLEAEPYNFRVVTAAEETLDVAAGLVIRTNPAAQTLVAKGSQVTIFVSSGAPTAEVPERRRPDRGRGPRRPGGVRRQRDVSRTCRSATATTAGSTAQSVAGGQRAPQGSPIAAHRRSRRSPADDHDLAAHDGAADDGRDDDHDHHHDRLTAVALASVPSFGTVVWVAAGLLIGIVVWKTGIGMLRSLTRPLPPPPPPGEMRKVNVRYRCDVCGVELRLTMAPDEDPPPPEALPRGHGAGRPDHGVIELSTGFVHTLWPSHTPVTRSCSATWWRGTVHRAGRPGRRASASCCRGTPGSGP